jgi:hypothetical protein
VTGHTRFQERSSKFQRRTCGSSLQGWSPGKVYRPWHGNGQPQPLFSLPLLRPSGRSPPGRAGVNTSQAGSLLLSVRPPALFSSTRGSSDSASGMYNVPSFTLARAVGGILAWHWASVLNRSHTSLIIIASVSRTLKHLSKQPNAPRGNTVLTIFPGVHSRGGLLQHCKPGAAKFRRTALLESRGDMQPRGHVKIHDLRPAHR